MQDRSRGSKRFELGDVPTRASIYQEDHTPAHWPPPTDANARHAGTQRKPRSPRNGLIASQLGLPTQTRAPAQPQHYPPDSWQTQAAADGDWPLDHDNYRAAGGGAEQWTYDEDAELQASLDLDNSQGLYEEQLGAYYAAATPPLDLHLPPVAAQQHDYQAYAQAYAEPWYQDDVVTSHYTRPGHHNAGAPTGKYPFAQVARQSSQPSAAKWQAQQPIQRVTAPNTGRGPRKQTQNAPRAHQGAASPYAAAPASQADARNARAPRASSGQQRPNAQPNAPRQLARSAPAQARNANTQARNAPSQARPRNPNTQAHNPNTQARNAPSQTRPRNPNTHAHNPNAHAHNPNAQLNRTADTQSRNVPAQLNHTASTQSRVPTQLHHTANTQSRNVPTQLHHTANTQSRVPTQLHHTANTQSRRVPAQPNYNPNAQPNYNPNAQLNYNPNAQLNYNPNVQLGRTANAQLGRSANAQLGRTANAQFGRSPAPRLAARSFVDDSPVTYPTSRGSGWFKTFVFLVCVGAGAYAARDQIAPSFLTTPAPRPQPMPVAPPAPASVIAEQPAQPTPAPTPEVVAAPAPEAATSPDDAKAQRSAARAAIIAERWRERRAARRAQGDYAEQADEQPDTAPSEPAQTTRYTPKAQPQPGILRINSRPWSNIFVDGQPVGHTPQMNLQLPSGQHQITLINNEMQLRKAIYVTINTGETTTQTVNLAE